MERPHYTRLPEFKLLVPGDVINVPTGAVMKTTRSERLRSLGFNSCSALVFQSEDRSVTGLMHAGPHMDESFDFQLPKLEPFENGALLSVHGSKSADQRHMIDSFAFALNIDQTIRYDINTRSPGNRKADFHVAYRPFTDEVLIARDSQQDVLILPGFTENISKTAPVSEVIHA